MCTPFFLKPFPPWEPASGYRIPLLAQILEKLTALAEGWREVPTGAFLQAEGHPIRGGGGSSSTASRPDVQNKAFLKAEVNPLGTPTSNLCSLMNSGGGVFSEAEKRPVADFLPAARPPPLRLPPHTLRLKQDPR